MVGEREKIRTTSLAMEEEEAWTEKEWDQGGRVPP